jgi:hypothetical protein
MQRNGFRYPNDAMAGQLGQSPRDRKDIKIADFEPTPSNARRV